MAANSFQKKALRDAPQTIAELGPNVLYRVPVCGDETVRRSLINAYSEFCRRSSCFTSVIVCDIEEGVTDYPVLPKHGGYVDAILRAWTEHFILRENKDYAIVDGIPVVLRLATAPSELFGNAPKLHVLTVEQPMQDSSFAPQWFIDRYGPAIISGALAEIYAMQGMPWYRPDAAIIESRKFQDAIHGAKMRSISGTNASSGRTSALDLSNLIV